MKEEQEKERKNAHERTEYEEEQSSGERERVEFVRVCRPQVVRAQSKHKALSLTTKTTQTNSQTNNNFCLNITPQKRTRIEHRINKKEEEKQIKRVNGANKVNSESRIELERGDSFVNRLRTLSANRFGRTKMIK